MAHKDIILEVSDLLIPHLAAIDENRGLAKRKASPFLIAACADSPAYVQALASHKGGWLWVEASSLQSVPELSGQLTASRRRKLRDIGFQPPNELSSNHWRRLRGGSPAGLRKAAQMLAEALVKVFRLRRAVDLVLEVHLLEKKDGEAVYVTQFVIPPSISTRSNCPDDAMHAMETWAVEIDGEPGVRLYEVSKGSAPLLWDALDSQGLETLDTRPVRQWAISTPQPPWAPVSDDAIGGVADYRFDPTARCWRPPDQPFAAPKGQPLQGIGLRMSVELPDAGWLPVRLEAGDVVVEFAPSNVFDPFAPSFEPMASRDWVGWLKAVAEDGLPRLTLDLEGHFLEFHILEPERSTVRFIVASASLVAWRTELDMRIERRALVEALYRPLLALWESAEFAAAWRQWCFFDSEPDYERPWRVRSNLLDAWLG